MTDLSLVKNELYKVLNCDEAQILEYEGYINNAVICVNSLLKNSENENDIRIVNLCAMKAYYQIALTNCDDDGITSFKAGDISYTKDMSSVTKARELLNLAISDCGDLISRRGFAFKAV